MPHADLQRWLDKSTRGLDSDLADMIREEIWDHYEDALADYLAEGYNKTEAHQLTMRDLGDESAVRKGFHQVHGSGLRYLLYAVIGAVFPLAYILSIPFNESLVGDVAFNLAIFLPMIYIVSSFRMILRDHYRTNDIEKNIMLVRWGIIILCITRLIGWRIYHQPTILESYTRGIFDAVSLWEMGLNFVSIAGLLLAAFGFVFIGEQTLRLKESLFGLLKPLGFAVIISGAGFAIYGLGSLVGMADVSMVAEMVTVMAGMIATLIWSFIFWCERQTQLITA